MKINEVTVLLYKMITEPKKYQKINPISVLYRQQTFTYCGPT